MGRSQLLERDFETAVCLGLAESGWLYEDEGSSAGWDPELALHPADALYWLATQYPDEYAKAVDPALTGGGKLAAERKLLEFLSAAIGRKVKVNPTDGAVTAGLLKVLRTGFKYTQTSGRTSTFGGMVAFRPASAHLVKQTERAEANRLRVIRQVRFDTTSTETIDLVLLVNGVPVATLELKTDNVQSIEDAKKQYVQDRKPARSRRLLEPGRCLVHFAVSNEEVYMTTELAGQATRFLPFNRGNDGHAGNPVSENGSATDYLWSWALERELFLRILKDYAVWEPTASSASGFRLVFPRFHQLRAVEAVTGDVSARGSGGSYLIWHSAGSGKTKTIAWLAHRLARHMDAAANNTFDSVIVVSDRRALDANLREGIGLLQASEGLVVSITGGRGSKSAQLRQALREGGHIITCTLQTFPEVLDLLEGDEDLSSRHWCVIADEAHSSQSGQASHALRQMLTSSGGVGEVDDGEFTTDELLSAKDSALAVAANMTFIALTATPKAKTLRLFGTQAPGADRWEAFDTYTMAQAIEEGFILDVLKNYSTYEMFARVRDAMDRDELVDKDAAITDMIRFVKLHPTAISQKVEIVIDHFLRNVAHHLNGKAKAMVVTEGREAAFTWSRVMNEHIAQRNLGDRLRTLVAFSGPLEIDGQTFTEAGLNGLSDAGAAFKADDTYRVMIVADKYQTGYDEPRLCAMYVDKNLNGIATVQTLSRLNRIYPDKPSPMIVDFVNDPVDVQADFAQFYFDAHIDTDVDPNALHNLAEQLDGAGVYTEAEMVAISQAYLDSAGHEQLRRSIATPVRRWSEALRAARLGLDKEKVAELLEFRRRLRSYEHAWDFLSQIIDYQDPSLHRRAIVANLLVRNLIDNRAVLQEDYLSGLEVEAVVLAPLKQNQDLSEEVATAAEDAPMKLPEFGRETTAGERTPVQEKFDEVVQRLNDYFHSLGLPEGDDYGATLVRQVVARASADPEVREVIDANEPGRLRQSKKLRRALDRAVFKVIEANNGRIEALVNDQDAMVAFRGGLADLLVFLRQPGGEQLIAELTWKVDTEGDLVLLTNVAEKTLLDVEVSADTAAAPVRLLELAAGQSVRIAAPRHERQGRQVQVRWRVRAGGPVEAMDMALAD